MKKRFLSFCLIFTLMFFNSHNVFANPVVGAIQSTYAELVAPTPPQMKAALLVVLVGLGLTYVGVEGYQIVDKYISTHDLTGTIKATASGSLVVASGVITDMRTWITQAMASSSTIATNFGTDVAIYCSEQWLSPFINSTYSFPAARPSNSVYFQWPSVSWGSWFVMPNFGLITGLYFARPFSNFPSVVKAYPISGGVVCDRYGVPIEGGSIVPKLHTDWRQYGIDIIGSSGGSNIGSINWSYNFPLVLPSICPDIKMKDNVLSPDSVSGDLVINPTYNPNLTGGYPSIPFPVDLNIPSTIPWTYDKGILNPSGDLTIPYNPSIPIDVPIDVPLSPDITGSLPLVIPDKFNVPRFNDTLKKIGDMDTTQGIPPKITIDLKAMFNVATSRFGSPSNPFTKNEYVLFDFAMLNTYKFMNISLINYFRSLIGLGFVYTTILYVWKKITPSEVLL